MQRYNKNNTSDLKELLYHSNVHDAKLQFIEYNYADQSVVMSLYNSIFREKITLCFVDIAIVLANRDHTAGNDNTVISLTVEDDFSYLQNKLIHHNEYAEDYIYLLFQLLCGDEVHIVAKEVFAEII